MPGSSPSHDFEISIGDVRAAAERIAPYVVRTPTLSLPRISDLLGLPVVAKLELHQHSGSFKVRGAFNRMLCLDDAERLAGVVAVSGGNHGLAVAYAARVLGLRAAVVMPETTALSSIAGARSDGAEVVLTRSIAEAFAEAHRRADAGAVMIHPFDDPLVIAGQGTLALELFEDAPGTTDAIASIGGGGMISGVLAVARSQQPRVRVWGVETEGADSMSRAIAAGHPVQMTVTSIAKTLGPPSVSDRTLALVGPHLEDLVVVSDAEAVQALEILADQVNVITEPAAACVLAAALQLRDRFAADARLALVLCGGNASLADVARWRTELGSPAAV